MIDRRVGLGLGLLLLIQTAVMIPQLVRWSPVWDEPAHLNAGLVHWRTLDFRLYSVNPPLCRMLATLPCLLLPESTGRSFLADRLATSRDEFYLGSMMFEHNVDMAMLALRTARCVAMLWALAGTLLVFSITSRLLGRGAAWVASLLWAFHPLAIAHGVLLPPDLPAAVGLMGVTLAMTSWWTAPKIASGVWLGVVLGVGLLIKTTLVVAVLLSLGLMVTSWLRRGNSAASDADSVTTPARPAIAMSWLLAMGVALFVINSFYGWSGSFTTLGEYEFKSRRLQIESGTQTPVDQGSVGNRFRDTWLGGVPVPLPIDFVRGIDLQYHDFEMQQFLPYLLGRWSREGFFGFYVWYFLLKSPLPWLLMVIAGGVGCVFGLVRTSQPKLLITLAAMGVGCFVFVSYNTGLNYCQRYALISMPLMCVLGGAAWQLASSRYPRWLVIASVVASVGCGVASVPHSFSYYNAAVGGVENGRFMLSGNATDWGQNHLQVARWCRQHPDRRPVMAALVGAPMNMRVFGIDADEFRFDEMIPLPIDSPGEFRSGDGPVRLVGWHVVSTVHLLDPRSPYRVLRDHDPVQWIGTTHAVFEIDEATAERLRAAPSQPTL